MSWRPECLLLQSPGKRFRTLEVFGIRSALLMPPKSLRSLYVFQREQVNSLTIV